MSLTIFLTESVSDNLVFTANITHNLNTMAKELGVYKELWRPLELDITRAYQLLSPLEEGLKQLKENPEHYKQFNPLNGWGNYDNFVSFIENYLAHCKLYPASIVETWD